MAKYSTIGGRFKNICFVGLNKVEYFPERADEPIFADSWQDVTDEQSRRHLALFFFAPRDLDGTPMDPYIFLTEGMEEDESSATGNYVAQQMFGDIPMVDMCRVTPAAPNTLNIVVVADVIFHWDATDSYIQPTSSLTWAKDVQQIMKGYPRSTEKKLFTNWDTEKVQDLELVLHTMRDLPLDYQAWINQPTFQQKYGTGMLAISLAVAVGTYGLIYLQGQEMDALTTEIRKIEATTPRGQNFDALARMMTEQQQFMQHRALTPLVTKDVGHAIQAAGMKAEKFEIKAPNPQVPPDNLLVTITAQDDVYKGWLEEEPIAKAVLSQSVTMSAIRKPPGNNQLTLEGLVELPKVAEKVETYRRQVRVNSRAPTSMRDVPAAPAQLEQPAQPEASDQPDQEPQAGVSEGGPAS